MIIAQKMENSMGEQKGQFPAKILALLHRLAAGLGHADDNITQCHGILSAAPKLDSLQKWKGKHVGGFVFLTVKAVQFADFPIARQND